MADTPINSRSDQEVVVQNGVELRRTIAHLPAFYRTDANTRFLSSTLDPLIQKGALERLDGYIGKQDAYTRKLTDTYVSATNRDRMSYQLEPTVTYTDKDTTSINPEDQVQFTGTYDDYINQIKYFGGNIENHDRLNKENVYAWNPAIDLDKLVNYREYFWMPEGPNAITIDSVGPSAAIEIDVTAWPNDGSTTKAWKFGTKASETNPQIKLYKGNTYKFKVDALGHPFHLMTEPYKDGSSNLFYTTGVTNAGTDKGTVTFTVPTDAPNVLYYQCGNHDSMYGIFTLDTVSSTTKINVADNILGTRNYALRTLNLSNGMKIKFEANVTDSTYAGNEYYVEGVGDSITLTNIESLMTPESYATETTILYGSTAYDSRPYAKAFYRPETKDYITIKRDSRDQNAWSRYNRWFHKSVINATAKANGFTPTLIESDRAKRPIIEFDSGLALYDHGTVAKTSVTLFDTTTTDAFSTVVKQTGYIVDGITIANGMRVVFSADTDTLVKNKIYVVNFVQAGDSTSVINLTEATDSVPADNESIFIEFGTKNQGKTYYYNKATTTWNSGQTKIKINQTPLFGMWDNDHISFDDATAYPNSSFKGAKVFEYKISDTATTDTVLGLKVKYNTINNVGDLVFDSDHTAGSFTYRIGNATNTKKLSEGHLHYTTSLTTHNSKGAWVKRLVESKQRVIRTVVVDDSEKQLFPIDFYKDSVSLTDLEVSVSVNGIRKNLTTDYTLVDGTVNKYVKFVKELTVGDQLKLEGYSKVKKIVGKGIYEVPENLSVNPLNVHLGTFTYGQVLGHVKNIFSKNTNLTGSMPGESSLRDNPDADLIGGLILQHEGTLLPAVFGLIDQESNVLMAIDYCNHEYEKFYNAFLTHGTGTAYEGLVADRVDEIITKINQGKTVTSPFFYEDMIGVGENYSLRTYTVPDPSETEYAIDSLHIMTTTNNRAVYVYKNDVQLILGTDYTVSTTDDSVNILSTLVTGDIIKIRDYSDTTGSYVPPTPSKLGLYPAFKPESFTDDTYVTNITAIRRHDGSIIKAYGDERDELIIELEKRIYNNIKTSYDSTLLDIGDVIPSGFTATEYTLDETNKILGPDFYVWAGRNGVQYINNTTFKDGSPFTYNYSASTDRISSASLPGHWRGIYNYFYDTDSPHIRPWEMLGHSVKPSTWESTYGTAPYTSGNTVLWEAVAVQPGRYGKPNITSYIPVDASGNLLDPLAARLVENFDIPGRNRAWKFGDQGPAETAWRKSSSYPFTVIKMLAVTKPAKFFNLFFDNSRLTKNASNNLISTDTLIRQNLSTAKYHLETSTDSQTGVVTRYTTAGYQPFVVNYLSSKTLDPNVFFYTKMKGLNVQLAYKLGGFTDKNNLKVLTDSVSPGSASGSKFIPDENYKILFRTSNPVNSLHYSGVLIEKNTDLSVDGSTLTGGYKVLGYSTTKPFFNFYWPVKNITSEKISVAGAEALTYSNYDKAVQTIPYGHVFDTRQEVVDFLMGYGKWLGTQGFIFDKFSNELKEVLTWKTSVSEFLFWTTQEWTAGSAITVSPGAEGFQLDTENSIVGKLKNLAGDYSLLDAGGRKINIKDISTKRLGKTFDITINDPATGLYNVALNTVQKEHILLFDNKTVFSDIIYEPYTGYRQARLKLVGWKTSNWNGDYYAPGFMFDTAQVTYWVKNTDYKIGDTIEYQGKFYVSKVNHNSSTTFINESWMQKDEKPAPQLIPNFDYKISRFNDFYSLESNNFDESQQSLAQHLIGYQSRDYLENLFVNDISQYKFYQGYIQEKGTQNAIDKLLKAKYEEQDISLDLYPEWMIRTADFGNTDSKESIQITLDDDTYTANSQSIELYDTSNESQQYARSVYVDKNILYTKPVEYTASTTFSRYNYTTTGIDRDFVQVYKTAGYPQLTQVQHTAYDITDLLNLDVNSVTANDLIWVANKSNLDWDVFRLTTVDYKIAYMKAINSKTQLEITFTNSHGLTAGSTTSLPDYFAIASSQSTELNSVYLVQSVPSHKTVVIDYTGSTAFMPTLEDGSTADSFGNVYKFTSVRISSMNNVNDMLSYSDYNDLNDSILKEGDKVFADADASGLWRVYEKQDPNTQIKMLSPSMVADQGFGYSVVARNDGRTVVVAAPSTGQGTIHFLFRRESTAGTSFLTTASLTTTAGNDNTGKLGYSLSMSTDENFVVAGGPYTNSLGSDGSTRFNNAGLIKMFVWDITTFKYGTLSTITPPTDEANQHFGWAHKICEPTVSSLRATPIKYMFVSAPGLTTDTGRVYMYEWGVGADGSTYDTWTQCLTIDSAVAGTGKKFGQALASNDNGDILAVRSKAPGQAGMVEIFVRTTQSSDDSTQHAFTLAQTLTGISNDGSSLNREFGQSLTMNKDGTILIIGAPGADKTEQADAGKIYYYKWNVDGSTNTYTLQQTIEAPDTQVNMRFGSSLDINDSGTRIVIGAEKFSNSREHKFDAGETTFDLQDTRFVDENIGSGGAYTATMYNTEFVIDDRLITTSVSPGDDFGRGICIIDQSVLVGAPEDDGNLSSDGSSIVSNDGTVTCFDLTTDNTYAWKQIAYETALIDDNKLGQVFDFNKDSKQILNYFDLYDPIKGRILGIADREINIKTVYDPASYNYGENIRGEIAWAEDHIGKIWWDLSTVKWLWYEQGDQEFKINNWGKVFPGSSIDIYEWVESTMLPSEWNAMSTSINVGTSANTTGSPQHIDDTRYTVKQKYSSALDGFVNYYYYWVKNKQTMPTNSVVIRKNTAAFIATIILNPQHSDIRHYSVTDNNKLLVFGAKQDLSNDEVVLNIDIRTNTFEGEAHSVWKLAREGDKDFRPGTQIETRWWDSLIGTNNAGDIVPDLNLPINVKYGNRVRPRQSWYVNRFDALKEIIDYANSVLKGNQLTGIINLDNLNAAETEPTAQSLEWDEKVDTYAELTYINTNDISGTANYLVQADETVNGFWAIYKWNGTNWARTKVQTYNTANYWSYINWYKDGYNENTQIDKQVTYQYELDTLELGVGKIVKVTSADTGGWKLYCKKITEWDNIGTENGTIRLSTKLYDYSQDATGFADADNFDDNFFDQEPAIETRKILTALRDNLFVNNLAVEYNTLFFIGLRRVLSEQTYVDWVFKTSFINAKNSVRTLDQRKTYTAGTDSWIESYINEVKPFHTKLREYKLGYTASEIEDVVSTDFDNPPFYDTTTGAIRNLNISGDTGKQTEYPHKFWSEYYKKHVATITIFKAGSGYTKIPTVTILGGTIGSTGPFQIYDTASAGVSSGSLGYYYPLYTSKALANIADTQNSGSGTSREFTFNSLSGKFYQPTSNTTYAQTLQSGTYKMYTTPTTTAATATAIIKNGSVSAITVTGIGANYTTTPTVMITGGKDDGTNPTDQAKAYANLNNDLVRDFSTTVKFDRISATSSVVDWLALSSYAYGDLIRYKNQLYKATSAFIATSDFDDNLDDVYKVYGDETGLSAADRTKGFYTPTSGMAGNELSQVMSGVDYGGTMVTGLLFSQGQGWDKAGWYDYAWDSHGATKIKKFYGDGSTVAFTFTSAPATTEVFQVYINSVKQTDVVKGDGSTKTFTLSSAPADGVLVEFIPFDDDGVLTPTDDRTLDSIVKGGLFNSALGTAPSDILMEGDDFISPETSYAPEEAVPGQMFDTVDIKVYTSPESGAPFITTKNYLVDSSTTTFSTGEHPGTLASVTVSVDGVTKKITTDYTINVQNKTITFNIAPATNSNVSIRTFAISGENYRVLDTYTGDGSTVAYITSTRENFNLDSSNSQIYITINGIPETAYTTSSLGKLLTVTFNSAPAANAYVQVAGFNQTSATRAYAQIMSNTITYDGSTDRYTLTYPPGAIGPYSGLTMIELNGKMLRGPDNTYYLGDGSTYNYGVVTGLGDDSTVDPSKTISSATDVQVFVNGVQKILNTDYTVDIGAQTVSMVTAPTVTDVIAISTLVDNHYYNEGNDIILIPSRITSPYSLSASDIITVTTFNNALGTKLRREVLEGKSNGIFKLRFDPLNSDYTTVWLNGTQLIEGHDYLLSGSTITVVGKTITASDRLDVMYFALGSATSATGFRIFKDMLNRTFYKRISKTNTTAIANDIMPESSTIQVVDGTKLPEVTGTTPGVIFVDKERIEYFIKSGDTLSQLRRGTLGTGIKEHSSGAEIVDASGTQTIPYADTVYTDTYTGDGSTVQFTTTKTVTSASQLDIFIGGQRLLLTSEDGSTINYSASGTNVTLSTIPASGTQVKILHKKGQVWYTGLDGNPADGKGLQASTTQQAKFIATEPTNAPE
jgi:hypothetical protein